MDLNEAKSLNKQLVNPALDLFEGSKIVATGSKSIGQTIIDARRTQPDFTEWFGKLRKTLSGLMWADGPVTCLECDGLGCKACSQLGKVPLGQSPCEESKIELAVRLLLNAIPYCPPSEMPMAEQALELMCRRWTIVKKERKR